MKARGLSLALVALASTQAQAAPKVLPRHGLVMFSSECISEQSSDGYGMRVTLRRIGKVDDMVLERADFPIELAWPLTFDATGRRLTFESRAGEPAPKPVEGRISRDGMTLELRGLPFAPPEYREVLKRVTDFSRPTPLCGPR